MVVSLMHTGPTALALISVTAAAWFGDARGQAAGVLALRRIGFQRASLSVAVLTSLGLLEEKWASSTIRGTGSLSSDYLSGATLGAIKEEMAP